MPSRRAVLGAVASAFLSGCAGNALTGDDTGPRTDAEPADRGDSPSGAFADVAGDETAFDRPTVATPDAGACSRTSRPPAPDGVAYPAHPGGVTELSALRFARAYETALARSRVAASDATAVAAEPDDSSLKAPATDDWYVASVTVELTVRAGGETRRERVGGTYFLTDEAAMRAEGASRLDGRPTERLSAAVAVACP